MRDRRARARARADVPDPLPAELQGARAAAAARRRAAALHRPGRSRRRGGAQRLAFDELLAPAARPRAANARARARGRAGARRAGRADRALPRRAAVRADEHQERAIAEIDRDLARTRRCSGCSRATSAPGRRSSRSTRCSRGRAGRQGALMAPTETLAEQHFLTVERLCRELGVTVRAADDAARQARARRGRRRDDPRRHARADPGGRRAARPRGRGRRRAAPFRRRAARSARRGPLAARPAHDRDADPAHARADGLRRPAVSRDREAARVAQADRDELDRGGPRSGGVPAADAASWTKGARRTSSAR